MEAVIQVMNTAVETYYQKEREVPSTDHKALEAAKDVLAKVAEAAGGDLSAPMKVMKLTSNEADILDKMKKALAEGDSSKAALERAKLSDKVQYVLAGIDTMNAAAQNIRFVEKREDGSCMSSFRTYSLTGSWEPIESGELMDLEPAEEKTSELLDIKPAEETAVEDSTPDGQAAEVVKVGDDATE